jgi:hypothetical protein
MDVWIDGGMDG